MRAINQRQNNAKFTARIMTSQSVCTQELYRSLLSAYAYLVYESQIEWSARLKNLKNFLLKVQ